VFSNFKGFIYECLHRPRRRRGGQEEKSPPPPRLGKSGTYPGKFENIRANLKIEHTIHLEICCFEYSDRLFPPQTVLLSHGNE